MNVAVSTLSAGNVANVAYKTKQPRVNLRLLLLYEILTGQ